MTKTDYQQAALDYAMAVLEQILKMEIRLRQHVESMMTMNKNKPY